MRGHGDRNAEMVRVGERDLRFAKSSSSLRAVPLREEGRTGKMPRKNSWVSSVMTSVCPPHNSCAEAPGPKVMALGGGASGR